MTRLSFTEHPASVGETYGEHLASASGFAARLACASAACLVHGLLPFLFTRTGSGIINELHARMVLNRSRQRGPRLLGSFESAAL
jgi:Family of unknown function (DUF6356)